MRKLFAVSAVLAVSIGLVVASGASAAVKSPKLVGGTISVFAAPTTIAPDTPVVTVSGNVQANSSCRKDRTVDLFYSNDPGTLVGQVETGPNGDYAAVVPKPTIAPPAVIVLQARVEQQFRKVGSKKKGKRTKKGRQFNCLELNGQSAPLNVVE